MLVTSVETQQLTVQPVIRTGRFVLLLTGFAQSEVVWADTERKVQRRMINWLYIVWLYSSVWKFMERTDSSFCP